VLKGADVIFGRNLELLVLASTGSPVFIENYFKRPGFVAPIQFVENKVLRFEDSDAPTSKRSRRQCVGWFGMIRCRRSLEVLSSSRTWLRFTGKSISAGRSTTTKAAGISAWLLPNRIYEGCCYGAVTVAISGVETGRRLSERDAGVVCDERLSCSRASRILIVRISGISLRVLTGCRAAI
jgi:succinoglycan biosynthesis protein ExoL